MHKRALLDELQVRILKQGEEKFLTFSMFLETNSGKRSATRLCPFFIGTFSVFDCKTMSRQKRWGWRRRRANDEICRMSSVISDLCKTVLPIKRFLVIMRWKTFGGRKACGLVSQKLYTRSPDYRSRRTGSKFPFVGKGYDRRIYHA